MRFLFLTACLILLAGCGSSVPVHNYLLLPLSPAAAGAAGPAVALSECRLPSHVEGRPMVIQVSAHEVKISDLNVWVEPLRNGAPNCLVENLRRRLGTPQVVYRPVTMASFQFAISIQVRELIRDPSGKVVLKADWEILSLPKRLPVKSGSTSYAEAVADDYADFARGCSVVLDQLSGDLAEALLAASRK